jgi:hypothetical protein
MTQQARRTRRLAALRMALTVGLVAVSALVPVRAAELLDRVLAVVSGTVITLSDARAVLALGLVAPRSGTDPVAVALRWLEDRQLVLDEINRYESGAAEPEGVPEAMEAIRARFASDADYAGLLSRVGLDEAGVRSLVRESLRVEAYVAHRFDTLIVATEDELKDYVARHPAAFTRGGQAQPFEAVQEQARDAVQQERRRQAIESWIGRLRRRGDISELYLPVR